MDPLTVTMFPHRTNTSESSLYGHFHQTMRVTGNYVRSTGNEIMPLCQEFAPTVNPPTDNHENWLLLSGMSQWFVARLSHWMFSAQKP